MGAIGIFVLDECLKFHLNRYVDEKDAVGWGVCLSSQFLVVRKLTKPYLRVNFSSWPRWTSSPLRLFKLKYAWMACHCHSFIMNASERYFLIHFSIWIRINEIDNGGGYAVDNIL